MSETEAPSQDFDPFDFKPGDLEDDSVIREHLDAGRSVIYADEALGGDYVQEMPDGTRYRVRLRRGEDPERLEQVPCHASGS